MCVLVLARFFCHAFSLCVGGSNDKNTTHQVCKQAIISWIESTKWKHNTVLKYNAAVNIIDEQQLQISDNMQQLINHRLIVVLVRNPLQYTEIQTTLTHSLHFLSQYAKRLLSGTKRQIKHTPNNKKDHLLCIHE